MKHGMLSFKRQIRYNGQMNDKPKLIVVLGPTATGKSDLAVILAKKFNGEVISADSRQVYRGLTIGTGKITKKETKGIPHHLLDVADPKKSFSVADYVSLASKEVSAVLARGKLPVICGGTGFYVDALVNNTKLPDVPPDTELRKRLAGKSAAELYTMLTWLDRERADTIDAQNPHRLIRAIEIAKHLGSVPPIVAGEPRFDTLFLGLTLPPEKLRKNIRVRLLARMKKGMVAEVRNLHEKKNGGVPWKRMEALGLEYRYLSRYLQEKISKEEMLSKLETEIYRYAKRQMTWFKRNKNIRWFSPEKRKDMLKTAAAFLRN
jgi:tRNA dimethylallyltransferase